MFTTNKKLERKALRDEHIIQQQFGHWKTFPVFFCLFHIDHPANQDIAYLDVDWHAGLGGAAFHTLAISSLPFTGISQVLELLLPGMRCRQAG